MIVIDRLEDLGEAVETDPALLGILDAILEEGATLVVDSDTEDPTATERALAAGMHDPSRLIALDVHRSTTAAPEGALA